MNGIDRFQNALVRRFDAADHMDGAIELRTIELHRQGLHLVDQKLRLPVADSAARLHGVRDQHELGGAQIARIQTVFHGIALVGFDIDAELAQRLDVLVDALTLGAYLVFAETLDDARHGHAMFGIGFLLKNLKQVQNLDFRGFIIRHDSRSFP